MASLTPARGIAYPQAPLTFLDESSVAFPFGSGVRVTFLAPDRGDGDGEFLWEESSWTEVTAVASSWRLGRVAVCVAGRPSPPILLYSYPDKALRGKLEGGAEHKYQCAAFCRGGDRLAAIGAQADKILVVWSLKRINEGDGYRLEGSKLVQSAVEGKMNFCSFNPANKDVLLCGGEGGLFLWNSVDLVDQWTVSSSPLPKTLPMGAEHAGAEEVGLIDALGSTSTTQSVARGGQQPRKSAACYEWGIGDVVWVAYESGDINCYSVRTGLQVYSLTAKSHNVGVACGLILTKTSLVIVGRGGKIVWLPLPLPSIEAGADLHAISVTARYPSHICAMQCSPLFDKFILGTKDGALLTVPIESERHERGLDATEIRTFHGGRVLCSTSLRALPATSLQPADSLVACGGEDGRVLLYSGGGRARLRGSRSFYVTRPPDEHVIGEGKTKGPQPSPVAVTCLASNSSRPILAVGLANGAVQVLLAQSRARDYEEDVGGLRDEVALLPLWKQQLFQSSGKTPVSFLAFHPTEPLLAVASSGDNALFVLNLSSLEGRYFTCTYATAPVRSASSESSGSRGIAGLMWRASSVVFSTEDRLLCCANVDSSAEANPKSASRLRWSFSTTVPLRSLCLHPIISAGPFFGISPEKRALLVLPALPEKALGSREDRQALDSIDALEAHEKAITVLAPSPDGKYMATGGADGLIVLWRVYEQHVELLHSIRAHSGPIISLQFSADGVCLYSSSADGTFMGVEVRSPGSEAAASTSFGRTLENIASSVALPPLDSSLKRFAEEFAKEDAREEIFPFMCPPWKEETEVSQSIVHSDDVKAPPSDAVAILKGKADAEKLAKRMEEFRGRVAALVAHNETREDAEALTPRDLIIDVQGLERDMSRNKEIASHLLTQLRSEATSREVIASRIRTECYESMEVKACRVQALQRDHLFVQNFPLRRHSEKDLARIAGVRRLRALELRDIRRSGHIAAKAWKGLLDEVPADVSWILGEGKLLPVVDIVKQLREAAQMSKGEKVGEAATGAVSMAGGSKPAGLSSHPGDPAGKVKTDQIMSDDEADEEEEMPSIDALAKDTTDETDTVGLLYPPLALYTPRQKRTQLLLLGELGYEMRKAFNVHFDALHAAKEDFIDKINERGSRLQEIANELSWGEEFCLPSWKESEIHDSVLDISKDITTEPYESQSQREARMKGEEERVRREAARAGDDGTRRALDDMMYGTLAPKEQVLLSVSIPRPECLDEGGEPTRALSAEEQVEVETYRLAIAELEEARENHRKALELEAKKLKTEIADLERACDDQVLELATFRLEVQRIIVSQEHYMTRIAVGIVNREDDEVTLEKIDRSLTVATRHNLECSQHVKAFTAHVDAAKETLDAAIAEDRALSQNFKKSIQESASNPIDMADLMPQLIQLFKLRDGGMGSANGSAGDMGFGGSQAFGMSASARTSFARRSNMVRGGNMNQSQGIAAKSSRRKRSSRVSNFVSSQAGSQAATGMGLLQNAMKEAMNREKKAIIVQRDPFCTVDEDIDKRVAEEAEEEAGVANQQLEYPGFDIEDQIWNRLLELRADKIRKEQDVRKMQKNLADMRQRLENLLRKEADSAAVIHALEQQREMVVKSSRTGERNLELIAKLKQGQDEVPHEAVTVNYSDAALIAVSEVNALNSQIQQLGAEKLKVLHRIKDFRKTMNMQTWERARLDAKCRDLGIYFTDLQLLRVTRKLQAMLKEGEDSQPEQLSQRQIAQRLEARIEVLRRSHSDKMEILRTANSKLARELRERMTENVSLEDGMKRLKESVDAREAILRTKSGAGLVDPAQKAAARMKQVTVHKRLVDLAQAQTEEIASLSSELERLRQKSFPSFVQATRKNRLAAVPDER